MYVTECLLTLLHVVIECGPDFQCKPDITESFMYTLHATVVRILCYDHHAPSYQAK